MTTVRRGSPQTRERLLDTAIELLAEHGLDGVSLGRIGVAAGQNNKDVIGYYFGSRDDLLTAIGEHIDHTHPRLHTSNTALLTVPIDPESAARIMVGTLSPLLEESPTTLRFLARVLADPQRNRQLAEGGLGGNFRVVSAALEARLGPHATLAYVFAFTLTIHALADYSREHAPGEDPPGRQLYVEELTQTVTVILARIEPATSPAPGR
ncbi:MULTISPECIES: TetR/AcrR family transcriptional regulator [unclassified Frankia]|uniref:TetR/AcrR family transcriptional regulator n=1 Tax=unclassified Frankia TaxID=2632575 RepID=UPI002AD4E1A8|nr:MULTISPECIES: TetR family transcriptional regulator [unclassified Frankia]